jgi:hypothetical protein
VNICLFLAFVDQAITGVFPGMFGGFGYRIHPIGGYVMIACVAIHLVFNWGWIKTSYFKRRVRRKN